MCGCALPGLAGHEPPEGNPAESDRGLVVDLAPLGITPPVRDDLVHALRRANGEVFYGFRPERTALSLDGKGLPLPVTLVERMGARTIVHLGEGKNEIKTKGHQGPAMERRRRWTLCAGL